MRNQDLWASSKYVRTPKGLRADEAHVRVRSRMIVDLIGEAYGNAIQAHAHGVLADVGCGKVPLYRHYEPLVDEVICIDWPGGTHGTTHLDIEADLNEGIPLGDAAVDTILATDVLEHLSDPDRFFASVARVLGPGGTLILGVPFLYWVHEAPHDHHRYTRFNLEKRVADHGLELVSLSEYGGPIAVLFDLVGKTIPTGPAARVFQSIARRAIQWGPVRRADRRAQQEYPLGYCLVARKPA